MKIIEVSDKMCDNLINSDTEVLLHYTEQDIIKGCLKNDRKFQEIFFKEYSPKINFIVKRYCKNSDEIVMNIFIHVFKNMNLIKKDSSIMDWLRTYTVEYCVTNIKNNTKINISEYTLIKTEDFIPNVEMKVDEIVSLINGLPLIQKLVYNMNIVDGLTIEDLSKLIEIDLIDVNRELINARENIKKKLLKI
jgi:DNA-directed RNA polymerase specialized sigma24 family protein